MMFRALLTGLAIGLAHRHGARQQRERELARAIRWYAQGAHDTEQILATLAEPEPHEVGVPAWVEPFGAAAIAYYQTQIANAEAGLQ